MSEIKNTNLMFIVPLFILGVFFLVSSNYFGAIVVLFVLIYRFFYQNKQIKLYDVVFPMTYADIIDKYGVATDSVKVSSLYYDDAFIPQYTRIKGADKLELHIYENNLVLNLYERCLDFADLSEIKFDKNFLDGYFFVFKLNGKKMKVTFLRASKEQLSKIKRILENRE